MIIVIEGPDGSGKTTLARQFEQRGFQYVHNGVPSPDEDLFEFYTDQILKAGLQDTVFDRLHLGEIVYGTIMRGKSLINLEQIRLLNRLLASADVLTVLCMPKFDTILENWRSRQDREYVQDPNKLEQIYNLYRMLVDEYRGSNHVVWDYTSSSEISLPDYIFRCPEGVIGSPRARFLFVGEKAGGPHDLAFYSHERSSHYLNECLWDAGYRESEIAFTNAYTMDGRPRRLNLVTGLYGHHIHEDQEGFSTELRPAVGTWEQKVIALGNLAQRRCEMEGIEHLKAPHPQYVKRFQSRQRWRYVELLRTFREA